MTLSIPDTVRGVVLEAVRALASNRLRTSLAAMGIVFGIATVVTALAIADGARGAAVREIGSLGINNVFLRARTQSTAGIPSAPVLTLRDVRAIADVVGPARPVAAIRTANAELVVGARRINGQLAGVTPSWRSLMNVELSWGRWFGERDDRTRRRVAVIGAALSHELFGGSPPATPRIYAAGNWYTVIGGLRARSNAGAGGSFSSIDIDRAAFMPLGAMDVSTGRGDTMDRVNEIGIGLDDATDVALTGELVMALAARRHGDSSQLELVVPRELLRARMRAQRTFHVVLLSIGTLALIISGIGIMNIMLASVVERTSEIGIRRAVGARRSDILRQFGFEAAALCVGGALVGVPLGGLVSLIVAQTGGWPVSVSAGAIFLALMMAVVVGVAFGVYPARVAANIEPIDALRSP